MTAAAQTKVRGWCPGVLRPMESGDGLVVRLKLTCGIVSLALATEIARWSRDWGNGEIDVTSRANLQLRGVSESTLPLLRDDMAEWGLLDVSPEAEAVRNVIASPLAGLDPDAVLDIRPCVERLERRLIEDTALHALPGKFGFAIDDGGGFGLGGVPADILLRARAEGDGAVFDLRLDGAPEFRLGPLHPDIVADMAAAIGRSFLERRRSANMIRRMRDWVERDGVKAVADRAGLGFASADLVAPPLPSAYLGHHPWGLSGGIVGYGLPFGRIGARELALLAGAAEEHGATELRLTPWRAILIPLSSPLPVGDALLHTDFIVDPNHQLRRAAACVGAPACPRATTDVRADATRLTLLLPPAKDLHVSGCAKGCAHPRPAAVTLVGKNGRYALIRDGAPWDRSDFENLTIDQAAEHLAFAAALP